MRTTRLRLDWLPGVLAALALVGFAVAFAVELVGYQHQVVAWARRDLASRTELAASNLERPLRTQDLRAVGAFAARCTEEGFRLTIRTAAGGRFFDSQASARDETASFSEQAACGDFVVALTVPSARVYAPFRRAVTGFCLAGLVGVAAVLLFFFVVYRQRVRLREMARLERFRADFIADVSHEIKTPLTGILGAVDLLEGDGEGQQQIVLLKLIKRESQRLNRLVQSILDLARLEREGDVIRCVETDLVALAQEVAERCGVAFSAGAAGMPHLRAIVDPQLVEEALANLIVNAQRHSGSTEISVRVSAADGAVRISVEDHGIGIPPDEAARIFERFHRVDPARAAETGGAGLGLAIVRRIARLHGGDAVYEPARPQGSVFSIVLPWKETR